MKEFYSVFSQWLQARKQVMNYANGKQRRQAQRHADALLKRTLMVGCLLMMLEKFKNANLK